MKRKLIIAVEWFIALVTLILFWMVCAKVILFLILEVVSYIVKQQ